MLEGLKGYVSKTVHWNILNAILLLVKLFPNLDDKDILQLFTFERNIVYPIEHIYSYSKRC